MNNIVALVYPQYVWLAGSLMLLIIWGAVYLFLSKKESRREMLVVSAATAVLGITEPLFVPEYWNPPSLFDLAARTGFDIESFIFAFAVGGLGVVLYEWIFRAQHRGMTEQEMKSRRHRFHTLILWSAPVIFIALLALTTLNPIYSFMIAAGAGGVLAIYCRPDLTRKMLTSAVMFFIFYFLFFLLLTSVFPEYVKQVWNLNAISGILILGVPLEELMFAFTFGFFWSSLYEHIYWKKVRGAEIF